MINDANLEAYGKYLKAGNFGSFDDFIKKQPPQLEAAAESLQDRLASHVDQPSESEKLKDQIRRELKSG